MNLTQDRLKELLDYDPETGVFIWKVDRGKRTKNKNYLAGTTMKDGYIRIKINYKPFLAHRLAFLWMDGYIPENGVDHIDRNTSNNKWNNLRELSQSCNIKNSNTRKDNKSGITGVHWYKRYKKWMVYIKNNNNKTINLGYFDNLINAVKARHEAEIKNNYLSCNSRSSAYLFLKNQGLI